jgi:hypothetical protein
VRFGPEGIAEICQTGALSAYEAGLLTFSTTIQSPYNHHTAIIQIYTVY